MKLMPYPAYKDSGVGWLGKVPQEWIVTKIKHVTSFTTGWTPPTGDSESFEGDNLWANISDLGPKTLYDTAKRVSNDAIKRSNISISPKGSLLFSFKLSIGQVGLAGCDLYTNEAIATFLPNNEARLDYFYYASTIFIVENTSFNIYGAKLLNQDLINSAHIAIPDQVGQRQIASFLDTETGKLDTLIAKQEHLIELLHEKRQAIISHAVTKGLNQDAKMKDSDVPWLGKVPVCWKVLQFRHMASIKNGSDYKHIENEDGEYPVIGSGGEFKRATDYIYDGVSVLLGRKGTIDKPLFIEGKFWVVDTMFYTIIKNIVLPKFVFNCAKIIPFDLLSTSTALPSMTQNDLKALYFALPPSIEEQKAITEYIDTQTEKIDTLIDKAKHSIELAKEHRMALISAAVTGKIDIRDYVKELEAA